MDAMSNGMLADCIVLPDHREGGGGAFLAALSVVAPEQGLTAEPAACLISSPPPCQTAHPTSRPTRTSFPRRRTATRTAS